ncbi:bL12 family ribosomal protein [Leptothermofonsia sp. ETS-13]|uniref:bL12 family ribosomal protein n=1 Tax=Leptothermofonsia sp. ETS-13 TaxID=3035696 RepID=UPI003BA049E6
MKLIKKVFAALFLSFGFAFLLTATVVAVDTEDPRERNSVVAGCLIFGVPPTALGIWLVRSLHMQSQQEQRDRLRSAFFKLLKQGNGRLTPLSFAMETGLDGTLAKAYLDERAKEFNASFEVDEDGDLFYQFDMGITSLPARLEARLSEPCISGSTFDVVLESVPNHRKIDAIKVVRELTNLGLKEAKDLVAATPARLRERVPEVVAQECKRKLEAIGATVMVIEN